MEEENIKFFKNIIKFIFSRISGIRQNHGRIFGQISILYNPTFKWFPKVPTPNLYYPSSHPLFIMKVHNICSMRENVLCDDI